MKEEKSTAGNYGQEKLLGITDQPIVLSTKNEDSADGYDLLNINAYAEGLCEFISGCHTPMSIALQGGWGTGKSSVLGLIEYNLTKNKNVKVISINTWQYSHMDQGDKNLAAIFFMSLLEEMNLELPEKTKRVVKGLVRVVGKVALTALGADSSEYDNIVKSGNAINEIESLRGEFEKLVDEFVEKMAQKNGENKSNPRNRIVVLVDDLDRLNPDVAVELLEIIKLFLDVKRCVFVLAIDYDVVVRGVRSKYDSDISLDKCRSFFDKIIQLPFHMPVGTYKLNDMVKEYLGEYINNETIDEASKFASYAIGANPRALKRIVNAFVLLDIIKIKLDNEDEDDFIWENDEYAVLFCVLCIQNHNSTLYNYLSDIDRWKKRVEDKNNTMSLINMKKDTDGTDIFEYTDDDYKKINEEMENYSNTEFNLRSSEGRRSLKNINIILSKLDDFLDHIYAKNESIKNKYDCLADVIKMTAVTGRDVDSSGVNETKTSNRDNRKCLFNGVTFKKNRVALEVIKKYVQDHKGISKDELIEAFTDSQLDLKVIVPLSEAKKIYTSSGHKRHFIKDDEYIELSDCEVAVSTQWTAKRITAFIEIAKRHGYLIEFTKR